MKKFIQKGLFVVHHRYWQPFLFFFRKGWWAVRGMSTGTKTSIGKIFVTWPHKVVIGNHCNIEHHVYFKFDGVWSPEAAIAIGNNVFIGSGCEFNISKSIQIGNDCLIASGCRFIDHDHGTNLNKLMRTQQGPEKEILIGNNVWIGCNAIILKGVIIEQGAIVGSGSVVTKSIPSNEIWAGVPAKKIGIRQ